MKQPLHLHGEFQVANLGASPLAAYQFSPRSAHFGGEHGTGPSSNRFDGGCGCRALCHELLQSAWTPTPSLPQDPLARATCQCTRNATAALLAASSPRRQQTPLQPLLGLALQPAGAAPAQPSEPGADTNMNHLNIAPLQFGVQGHSRKRTKAG